MKLKILTMAYNRPDVIERGLESAYRAGVPEGTEHYLLDQHYPLPHRPWNRAWLRRFTEERGITLLDAGRNLGYHEGQNWAMNHMGLEDEDCFVNLDPDAMISAGSERWYRALRTAFRSDASLAVVGLNNVAIDRELKERGYHDEDLDSVVLRFPKEPVIMSIVAWNAGFLRIAGGLKEPTALYGGIESEMWPWIHKFGKRWAVLRDFHEDISLQGEADPEYRDWKQAHARDLTWPGDFESYLRHMGRIR